MDPGASGAVVVRPAGWAEAAAVLELWRAADAVPSVSTTRQPGPAAGGERGNDTRVGRFVRTLP